MKAWALAMLVGGAARAEGCVLGVAVRGLAQAGVGVGALDLGACLAVCGGVLVSPVMMSSMMARAAVGSSSGRSERLTPVGSTSRAAWMSES